MVRAAVITLFLLLNLSLWGTLVLAGGIVKLLTFGAARHRVILAMTSLAERWVQGNDRIFEWFLDTEWRIEGFDGLRRDGHYLVVSNHVSWIDIFAAFRALHGKAPFIRFFLKHILIWSPIVGQACWALEFPFMRRYSPEYLAHHPEKRGRDLETTRTACQRYRHLPVTILNFAEGTRFTREKHEDQESPYRHLLRPRAGGIGFVIASLGEQLDSMIDMTIVFPDRDVTIWDFVTNRVPWIALRARRIHIPDDLITPAITEPGPKREEFKAWVEKIWQEKDEEIARILLESGA
ncbi:MAG TPA: acetyltransferase [Thermoanaerobaculia bacterium]|nr:acetyltransferase [Thermoanaerobaculia bacterium]